MKSMKEKISAVLAGTLMLGSFSTAALAAPQAEKSIGVQLDGQMITLVNDAEPVINNGRVYLPFRSLFETLGAEVEWDQSSGIISAVKDGREVEFIGNQPSVVIKENNTSRIVNTSAAPYIENGKTMIPVRFAGEALGYNIGWDSTNKTVVMMDAEKLAAQYDGQFTYLEKLLNMNKEYQGKSLEYTATSNFLLMDESEDAEKTFYEFHMEFNGTSTADGNMAMDMTMTDGNSISQLKQLLAKGYSQSRAFNGEKISMDILCDMDNFVVYMKCPLLNTAMGMNADADAYFSIDLKSVMTAEDIAVLKNALKEGKNGIDNVHDYIVYILNNVDMDSVNDYSDFAELLNMVKDNFSDKAFKYDAQYNRYQASAAGISLDFHADSQGNIDNYLVQINEDNLDILMQGTKDRTYFTFEINDYGFDMSMDMNMNYKVSDVKELKTNPLLTNPNATIIPLM